MSDKQETGIKNGIAVGNSDSSKSAGTIRSRQHSINRQSVNDFEKALQRAPQYNKTLQDYRCIKIAIKALGTCDKTKLNLIRNQLQASNGSLSVVVRGEERKIFVKYVIVTDIEPLEPQLFGILQTHRKYTGLILISEASNPLNVAILNDEYEQIKSDSHQRSNIIDIRWLVFTNFDSSQIKKSEAIIIQDESTNHSDSEDSSPDQPISEVIVLGISTELVQEIVQELDERRLATEGTYDVYLEAGELPSANLQPPGKRKLQGRHRKYIGDLCLLTGLIKESLLNYHASVDLLRAANDHLWLACALEGECISSAIQIQEDSEHTITTIETVYDKLCESIKLFARFKQIALLEIETSCVSARIISKAGKNLEATSFVHNAVYVSMPNKSQSEKISRFHAIADLFEELNMPRKSSFFKRIAAMQSISLNENHWKSCLKSLEASLSGFGLKPKGLGVGSNRNSGNRNSGSKNSESQENQETETNINSRKPTSLNKNSLQSEKQWSDVSARVLNETSYACRKLGKPKKALQYLLQALDLTHRNLPMNKQHELVGGIDTLIDQTRKDYPNKFDEMDLDFSIPTLTKINLLQQPNFLRLKNKSSETNTEYSPFLYNPTESKNLIRQKSTKIGWKVDASSDAVSEDSIALNDSISVALVFYNPLKLPITLKSIQLLATVEYESLQTSSSDPLSSDNSGENGYPQTSPVPVFLNINEDQCVLTPKSSNSEKPVILSVCPTIQEPTSLLHRVKWVRIVGFKYKIFKVPMVTLFKDLYQTKDTQGGVNFNSLFIPVIKPIVPLLEPAKAENVLNQLNFRYKSDTSGFRSRLSVYPGEKLVSNATVENKAPNSAQITNITITKNDSKGLITAVPELSNISFSVGFENVKTVPIDVEIDSIEYLKKMKMNLKSESNISKTGSTIDLSSNGSGSNQSSIIDQSEFVVSVIYTTHNSDNSNISKLKLVDDKSLSQIYSRELDLVVYVQVRKGLEPVTITVEENDEESFKIHLTLYNHSKSNNFSVTFNEDHQIDIYANSEYTFSSVIPKLDRLNAGNPRQQLIDFLSKRLTFSWLIFDEIGENVENHSNTQHSRQGFWDLKPELIDALLAKQKVPGNQFPNSKIQENRYLLKNVFRPPIVIHSLNVYPTGKLSFCAELKWLNEQPSSPINPSNSRACTYSKESTTAFSGTVDITQNYKRQWYIDLVVFQADGEADADNGTGSYREFTEDVIFCGSVSSNGRVEGNEYGEIYTSFQFVVAIDPSHFGGEFGLRESGLRVQAKIYVESPGHNEENDEKQSDSIENCHEFYLSDSVPILV